MKAYRLKRLAGMYWRCVAGLYECYGAEIIKSLSRLVYQLPHTVLTGRMARHELKALYHQYTIFYLLS